MPLGDVADGRGGRRPDRDHPASTATAPRPSPPRPPATTSGAVSAELQTTLDDLDLPAGATAAIGGVAEDQDEAFAHLGLAMLAAIAIVFIIMVATFRTLVQPLILLVSIPFAATGAIGLLLATGTPLGVPALIGMLMLIGIVVTNAIVLIDLINQYRAQGMRVSRRGRRGRPAPAAPDPDDGRSRRSSRCCRWRSGVTGEGGFISQPLAIVVIGGLISSTLLTLVLVPTLYTLVEGRRERRASRKAAAAAAQALKESHAVAVPKASLAPQA